MGLLFEVLLLKLISTSRHLQFRNVTKLHSEYSRYNVSKRQVLFSFQKRSNVFLWRTVTWVLFHCFDNLDVKMIECIDHWRPFCPILFYGSFLSQRKPPCSTSLLNFPKLSIKKKKDRLHNCITVLYHFLIQSSS